MAVFLSIMSSFINALKRNNITVFSRGFQMSISLPVPFQKEAAS